MPVGTEWRRVLEARDLEAGSTNRHGLTHLIALAVALLVFVWRLWYWNHPTAVTF